MMSSRKTTLEQQPRKTSPIARGTFILQQRNRTTCTRKIGGYYEDYSSTYSIDYYCFTDEQAMDQETVLALQREVKDGVLPSSSYEVLMATNKHGDTSFHVAARHGRLELVKRLHEDYGVPVHHVNADGKTALHEAAQNGHEECVSYLLSAGSEIDCLKRADWSV